MNILFINGSPNKNGNKMCIRDSKTTVASTKTYTYNNLSQLTEIKESSTIKNGDITLTYTDQTLAKYTYDDFGNQTGQETYEVNLDTLKSAKTKDTRNTYDLSLIHI